MLPNCYAYNAEPLLSTVEIRGVKEDEEHSLFLNRYSSPLPHSTSQRAQLLSNRPITIADPLSVRMDLSYTEEAIRVIKVGLLSKTAQRQRDGGPRRGITRKRRFRLTEKAFEYFQLFSWNVGLQS